MEGHPLGMFYTGLAAELSALARLRRDGDLFYATDTGSLYVRVDNAWVSAAVSLPTLKVGGADDYLSIDTAGMLTLVGNAQVWDDIRIEPIARATGTNAPTFEQWFTDGAGSRGVYLYSFDNATAESQKEIHFTLQTPHSWRPAQLWLSSWRRGSGCRERHPVVVRRAFGVDGRAGHRRYRLLDASRN